MESIGRNPESTDKLFVPMLLGMAFAEAIAIYALVVTLLYTVIAECIERQSKISRDCFNKSTKTVSNFIIS